MSEHHQHERAAVSFRTMELVVALVIFVFGAIVIYDSVRVGAQWAEDGPQGGYFPFYIGLLTCLSAVIISPRAAFDAARGRKGSSPPQQLSMVPSCSCRRVFVGLIQFVGLYAASTLFIVFFMIWLGKYRGSSRARGDRRQSRPVPPVPRCGSRCRWPQGAHQAAFGLH